jgi:hypothetical protein
MVDEKDRKKWLQDVKWVLSTPQGRRFYWGLMARCKAFKDGFVESTNLSYFQKGQRTIGIGMLEDLLEADSSKYLQMVQENDAKETREDIKVNREIKDKLKNPTKISSPILPNTETVKSTGGNNE